MPLLELRKDAVVWTEEALMMQEVKELQRISKKSDTKLFNDVATYIYWAYKKEGLFANQLPTVRKEDTCTRFFPDRKWTEFESIPIVIDIIKLYVSTTFTVMEQMYEKMKKDIEELFNHYAEIPWTKKIKVLIRVPVEGEEDRMVTQLVDMSNAKEKQEALESANKIIDYEEKLRLKIFKETKDKRRGQALFDRS